MLLVLLSFVDACADGESLVETGIENVPLLMTVSERTVFSLVVVFEVVPNSSCFSAVL